MSQASQAQRIERIQEMEAAFDAASQAVQEFDAALAKFKRSQARVGKLGAYYGSADWFADRDAYEAGQLPADLKCGVLGEDVPYDVLISYHDLAIRMLECATRALKEG